MNFFSFGNGCIFQDVYFPGKYCPYLQFTQLYLTEYLLKVGTVLGTRCIMINTKSLYPCALQTFGGNQDGGVEGHALIFSCENSKKIATNHQTTIDRRMVDPTKKRFPKKDSSHPREKEKPQQDGWRGKIMFRIKPCTRQRHSEGSDKTMCAPETSDSTRD